MTQIKNLNLICSAAEGHQEEKKEDKSKYGKHWLSWQMRMLEFFFNGLKKKLLVAFKVYCGENTEGNAGTIPASNQEYLHLLKTIFRDGPEQNAGTYILEYIP